MAEMVEHNEECPICLEDFDDIDVEVIVCGCGTCTCISCVKDYLLNTTKEPHCHECHRGWDRQFMYDNFGPNWVNKTYKKHRKIILLEKEKVRMPEAIPLLKKINLIEEYDIELKNTKEKIQQYVDLFRDIAYKTSLLKSYRYHLNYSFLLSPRHHQIKYRKHTIFETQYHFNTEEIMLREYEKIKHLNLDLVQLNTEYKKIENEVCRLYVLMINIKNEKKLIKNDGIIKEEKMKFIKACPNDGCRGFLSSAYKCDLCKISVCGKCFEIKGSKKDATHVCKEDDIKSANLIKKETKPCPKCAVPIFKIVGCSQMWCTQCHITFSWDTGRIETGKIHNPHFYEWASKNNKLTLNAGDVVCGGLIDINTFYNITLIFIFYNINGNGTILRNNIQRIHRAGRHLQYFINELRELINRGQDNNDVRVRYLKKEIDDKQLAMVVMRRDNIREKKYAMLQVLELFNLVIVENFNDLYNNFIETNMLGKGYLYNGDRYLTFYKDKIEENQLLYNQIKNSLTEKYNTFIDNIYAIINYSNNEFLKISKNYNMKVYYIPSDLIITKKLIGYDELEKHIEDFEMKSYTQ